MYCKILSAKRLYIWGLLVVSSTWSFTACTQAVIEEKKPIKLYDTKLVFPDGEIIQWHTKYNMLNGMQCIDWRTQWQYGKTCYTPQDLRGITPVQKLHQSIFDAMEEENTKNPPLNTPETPFDKLQEEENKI